MGEETLTYDYGSALINGGSYLRTRWQLRVEFDEDLEETTEEASDAYLTAVKEYFVDDGNLDSLEDYNISMVIAHSNSISEESVQTVNDHIWLIIGAILWMFVLFGIMLGDMGCGGGRPLLAAVDLIVSLLSVLIGFCLGFAFGYELNSLVLIMVFLVIATSFANETVILESLNTTPTPKKNGNTPDEEEKVGVRRFSAALGDSGLSITITTVLKITAFAAATAVRVPGVQAFCAFTALAFGAEYRYVCIHFLIFVVFVCLLSRLFAVFYYFGNLT